MTQPEETSGPTNAQQRPAVPPPLPLPYATVPAKPAVWPAFVAFGIALLATVLASLLAILLVMGRGAIFGGAPLQVSSTGLLFAVAPANSLAVAATAIVAAALSGPGIRRGLRLVRAGAGLGSYAIMILGALAVSLASGAIISLLGLEGRGTLKAVDDAIRTLSPGGITAAALVLGLGPGIAEELLFRGFIQTRLSACWGPVAGILITAVLFGIMHLDPVQGAGVIGLGAYFGYVCERTRSLWPAIVCHSANNLLFVVLAVLPDQDAGGSSVKASLILLGASVPILLACLVYLRRKLPVGTENL